MKDRAETKKGFYRAKSLFGSHGSEDSHKFSAPTRTTKHESKVSIEMSLLSSTTKTLETFMIARKIFGTEAHRLGINAVQTEVCF